MLGNDYIRRNSANSSVLRTLFYRKYNALENYSIDVFSAEGDTT
jgi:hypothetical protein